ncbi:MAG: hypothetical protein M0Z41_01565 [Peptococcaceae bacterium]|jgi:hypothetical protein|nr:hypothetical protein [Peptococcaceae bacterium]
MCSNTPFRDTTVIGNHVPLAHPIPLNTHFNGVSQIHALVMYGPSPI